MILLNFKPNSMKKLETIMKGVFMSLLAVGVLTFSGCGPDDPVFVPTETLYELLSADPELSEMKGFIDADAALLGYAQGTTDYTFFAPNNAAFETLRGTLGTDDLSTVAPAIIASVMNFHFVAGKYTKAELSGAEVASVQGESVVGNADGTIFTGGSITAVEILSADNQATNGTMHVVGNILIPPTIFQAIGLNLGTVAQAVLLGAPFTDIVGIIGVADSDVPVGESSISSILADKTLSITAFVPANDVLAGVAAFKGVTKEQLIASFTSSPAAARGFLLNHISDAGGVLGSELVAGKTITMMTGNTYIVVEVTPDATSPLGIVLVNVLDQAKAAPVYALDLIDVNSTGAALNGSAHVSSILQ